MTNLRKVDNFIESRRGLTSSTMSGKNNNLIYGKNLTNHIFDSNLGKEVSDGLIDTITIENSIASLIKDNIDKKGGKQ